MAAGGGPDEEWEKARSEAARRRYASERTPLVAQVNVPVHGRTERADQEDHDLTEDERREVKARAAPASAFVSEIREDVVLATQEAQNNAAALVAKAAERALEKLREKQLQETRIREERRMRERLRAEARMREEAARKRDEDQAIAAIIAAMLDE